MSKTSKIVFLMIVISFCSLFVFLVGQSGESLALEGQPSGAGRIEHDIPQALPDLEALHAENIARLHGLYHQMKVAAKKKDVDRLTEQLETLKQALDVVERTEQTHPQWTLSWAQRHAKLLALSQEMGVLTQKLNQNREDRMTLALMDEQLRKIKAILDLW